MPGRKLSSLGVVSLAVAGAAALTVSPVAAVGAKTVLAEAQLLDTESWIMGGSGLPIPPPDYLTALSERYVNPAIYPDFSGGNALFDGQNTFDVAQGAENPLFTPEGLYPFTGIKNLELDPSVAQGVSILNSQIQDQIAAGNDVVAVGYSQSATINSLEMKDLLAAQANGDQEFDPSRLAFVLLGDPSNPDGGLLSRFDLTTLPQVGEKLPELTIPSLGVTFSGATPADTPWDTAIYTQEYDGFADFPKYPLNFLSDLNALLGIVFVHGTYPTLTADHIGDAIKLATSDDYTGAMANTDYYMIPTQTLPLLQPLESAGGFGKALADLLQPDLKILVDLGYGHIDTAEQIADGTGGWDDGPANVATPFGVFPDISLSDLVTALADGAKTGWSDFTDDLQSMPTQSLADATQSATDATAAALPSLTEIVNAFSGALSSGYAALLPTADLLNAVVTTLPTYDFDLFTQYLEQGDLLNAFGMPLAATTGLATMALGFEAISIENAISSISSEFGNLF